MTALADAVRSFAALLTPADENSDLLNGWITRVRAEDLPHLHAFTRGIELDRNAVRAALACPYHNGGTEGVNTKSTTGRSVWSLARSALARPSR